MAWDTNAPIGSANSPYYYDSAGNVRVKAATSPGSVSLNPQTRNLGIVRQPTSKPSSSSSDRTSSSGYAVGGGSVQSGGSSYPSFPRAPKPPAAVTIPDPDNKRIRVAEERTLARRKRGRFSTIMSNRPRNELN